MTEPHAVRWARRMLRRTGEYEYTTWHWTLDADRTVCGCPIPVGLEGTFFPETHDEAAQVTCARCNRTMNRMPGR